MTAFRLMGNVVVLGGPGGRLFLKDRIQIAIAVCDRSGGVSQSFLYCGFEHVSVGTGLHHLSHVVGILVLRHNQDAHFRMFVLQLTGECNPAHSFGSFEGDVHDGQIWVELRNLGEGGLSALRFLGHSEVLGSFEEVTKPLSTDGAGIHK